MELILHVRRVGSDGERKLLGGLVPLLRLLEVHATFEVFLAFFAERRDWQGQQANGKNQRDKCSDSKVVSHGFFSVREVESLAA